mgnify:FL=1
MGLFGGLSSSGEIGPYTPTRHTLPSTRQPKAAAPDCLPKRDPLKPSIDQTALRLFAPVAPTYERWAKILSLGQDSRWRAEMVAGLQLSGCARVLDVATGTGSIARLLEARGSSVVGLDQSFQMLASANPAHAAAVCAGAEAVPFAAESFDCLTFGYLLRYVSDPLTCMRELCRVVRPGGAVGMVEFGRPRGLWGGLWTLYTRLALPVIGAAISPGWGAIGRFLWSSIDSFHREYPPDILVALWRSAGLVDVRIVQSSLGGGLIVWGRKP